MSLDADQTLAALRGTLAERYGDDVAQSAILAYWARVPRPPLSQAAAFCWRVAWRHATLPRFRPHADRRGATREVLWDYRTSVLLAASTPATQLDRLVAREALLALPPAELRDFVYGTRPRPFGKDVDAFTRQYGRGLVPAPCHSARRHFAKGWCKPCYDRARRARRRLIRGWDP